MKLIILQPNPNPDRVLEGRGCSMCMPIFEAISEWPEELKSRVMSRIEDAGFKYVVSMGNITGVKEIITALVERWRPETNTFHFPKAEYTITLEDVHLITGLKVTGNALAMNSTVDQLETCHKWLVLIPPNQEEYFRGRMLKSTWLRYMVWECPNAIPTMNSSEEYVDRWTRSLLLLFIGGVLMPDKSANHVHLMWVRALQDFKEAGKYAWGAAVLGWLYRALGSATNPNINYIQGCNNILYAWLWFRISSLAPARKDVDDSLPNFPLLQM